MDPDVMLEWILQLRASLDAAVEGGHAVEADDVYTLVGLIETMDDWLAAGHAPETPTANASG